MRKYLSPVGSVGCALTVICFCVYLLGPAFIQDLSNKAYDALLRHNHRDPQSGRIAIVDLDDVSLLELGQWPWPRYRVADLTDRMLAAGASVIAFDIVFSEEDRTSPRMIRKALGERFGIDVTLGGVPAHLSDFDKLFADVLVKGDVILGCTMHPVDRLVAMPHSDVDPHYETRMVTKGRGNVHEHLLQAKGLTASIPPLAGVARMAFFNAVTDTDNIVRSNPLVWAMGPYRLYPALALEAVRVDRGVDQGIVEHDENGVTCIRLKDLVIPTDRHGRMIVNYRTVNEDPVTAFLSSFPTYRAIDVLEGRVGERELGGKIVFVGSSAWGLKDTKATPLTQHFSGVEVHATMVDNMLSGNMLRNPSWMVIPHAVSIFGVGIFLTMLIARGRSWLSFLVSVLLVLVALQCGAWLMRRLDLVFVPAWTIFTVVLIYPVLTMLRYWQEELQRKRVRDMFGTMVSNDVLEYLEQNPGSFSLSGERTEATVLFSDVRDFTMIAEDLEPGRLAELLNRYLTPMTDIIMERKGYVDKYEGDLIMAEWGVPFAMEDHAIQACMAAIEQQDRLAQLRPVLREEFGHDIHVRMGINSGPLTAGNMGSDRRFQYTVMGDTANQAARLEPANKDYGTSIMIGEATYRAAADVITARLLDRLLVKGKTRPVEVYELLGRRGELAGERGEVVRLYEEGLKLHWEQRWDEALVMFHAALKLDPADGPSATLATRVEAYKAAPPGPLWTGEYVTFEAR